MRLSRLLPLFAFAAALAAGGACAQDTDTAQAQWNAYLDRVGRELRASGEPRDWALAATVFRGSDADPPADASALLANAASAAPDDALVQWIYLTHQPKPTGACGRDGADPARLQRLAEREPDNAATWVMLADAAIRAGDGDGADRLLERAASSSTFDDHMSASIDAWHAVFRRWLPPVQNPAAGMLDAESMGAVPEAIAFSEAVFQSCTSPALTAMTSVRRACDAAQAQASDPRRYAYCAEIGQRMRGAKTGITQLMGHRLLHESGLESDADATAFYDLYDIYQRARELKHQDDPVEIGQMLDDWRTTGGNETEVLKRRLQRAGLSISPAQP